MTSKSTNRRTVGILIFDDVEVLDFCGPFQVFANALPAGAMTEEALLFKVVTIAPEHRLIRCGGGLLVQPHYSIENHPHLDFLVVPGGEVAQVSRNRSVLDWIIREDKHVEVLASVCTGAVLLAETGLLDGGPATTHWGALEHMRQKYSAIDMLSDERVVDRGHVITSAGISAGIDMALHLVARLHGTESANWTARLMEYPWNPEVSQNEISSTGERSQTDSTTVTVQGAPAEIVRP